MAGKVVNSSFMVLSKFGAIRQEIASKTATSHIRKPLASMSALFQKTIFVCVSFLEL